MDRVNLHLTDEYFSTMLVHESDLKLMDLLALLGAHKLAIRQGVKDSDTVVKQVSKYNKFLDAVVSEIYNRQRVPDWCRWTPHEADYKKYDFRSLTPRHPRGNVPRVRV